MPKAQVTTTTWIEYYDSEQLKIFTHHSKPVRQKHVLEIQLDDNFSPDSPASFLDAVSYSAGFPEKMMEIMRENYPILDIICLLESDMDIKCHRHTSYVFQCFIKPSHIHTDVIHVFLRVNEAKRIV